MYIMKCNYTYSIMGYTAIFDRTTEEHMLDFEPIISIGSASLIFNDVQVSDIPFLEKLLNEVKDIGILTIGISSPYIGRECAEALSSAIDRFVKEKPNNLATPTVSISAAMETVFSENVRVGAFMCSDDSRHYLMQPINTNSPLCYDEFISVRPIAEKIVESIPPKTRQSKLDSIVWIDNWFQRNITYATGRITKIGNKAYECTLFDDDRQACVPDILLRHIGACEDIATSVAMLLHLLGIPYKEVQGREHAWLLVEIGGINYIWDCTHNITRDESDKSVSNKATKYSDTFTLIGEDTFPNKYPTVPASGYAVSHTMFPREKIYESRKRLESMGVSFTF